MIKNDSLLAGLKQSFLLQSHKPANLQGAQQLSNLTPERLVMQKHCSANLSPLQVSWNSGLGPSRPDLFACAWQAATRLGHRDG